MHQQPSALLSDSSLVSRLSSAFLSVNFWYDMEFDIKFNYFQLLESLSADVQTS